MFQDFVARQVIGYCVPQVASFLKPYLTVDADKMLVAAARVEVAKIPSPEGQKYVGWAIDALASAWGV